MSATAMLLVLLMSATFPAVVRRLLPPLPEGSEVDWPAMVVVPGADVRRKAGLWQLTAAGRRRLERGIAEARLRGLPLLVSGGGRSRHGDDAPSEADLMAELVARVAPEIAVVRETRSRNTWENAGECADLLRQRGIAEILLITDRPHLTRATLCFRARGLKVLPLASSRLPLAGWVPSTAALAMLPELWYEWAALFWYELKYF